MPFFVTKRKLFRGSRTRLWQPVYCARKMWSLAQFDKICGWTPCRCMDNLRSHFQQYPTKEILPFVQVTEKEWKRLETSWCTMSWWGWPLTQSFSIKGCDSSPSKKSPLPNNSTAMHFTVLVQKLSGAWVQRKKLQMQGIQNGMRSEVHNNITTTWLKNLQTVSSKQCAERARCKMILSQSMQQQRRSQETEHVPNLPTPTPQKTVLYL